MKQLPPNEIISLFSGLEAFQKLLKAVNSSTSKITLSGLPGAASSLLIAALRRKLPHPLLIITDSESDATNIFEDLLALLPTIAVGHFLSHKEREISYSKVESLRDLQINQSLQNIISQKAPLIVTDQKALENDLIPPEHFKSESLQLENGQIIDREFLLNRLEQFSFSREYSVEVPSEYAVRGNIIDIFPLSSDQPVRIELDNNEIISLRTFSAETQRTTSKLNNTSIHPPHHYSVARKSTLIDYLGRDTLLFIPQAELLEPVLTKKYPDFSNSLILPIIFHNDLYPGEICFPVAEYSSTKGDLLHFKKHISSLMDTSQNPRIFFFSRNAEQRDRLKVQLSDIPIRIFNGSLKSNIEIPEVATFIYADNAVFKKNRGYTQFQKLHPEYKSRPFKPDEINKGDLLVHTDYGIGRYRGLRKVSAFNAENECLILEYQDNAVLYVPLEKMNRVHKYISTDGYRPVLNRLGSGQWDRVKLQTKRSAQQISQEIIELYAKRIRSSGHPFAPDCELQLAMETEFIYDETPDQRQAINEIKTDMERSHPMDRLLCGDVGFGKTEIAIRAAFKAVANSKQVAVLCPTTILADQHYHTFRERLKNYPVHIDLLSRFVPKTSQKKVIEGIKKHRGDILIGTHRLLSKDVRFHDLGLLIIDEEHRFGVKDKEKIKSLRSAVDVLSLSATPIPRSLRFSLIGVRELSLVNTPPKYRLPTETEIISFNKNIIRDAILHEIGREGQVYFIHNEIRTISSLCNSLQQLLPVLRVEYVHGQMPERAIEPIMNDFIQNKIHVLVSTAILESGIDIPNVNTIFINRAHTFGLSQLYQLRGRVGRGTRQAYAYLIVTNPSKLTKDAIKRLHTIQRHTSLGSGYSIALQDLEMRGAGNALGLEQSGHIHTIGYNLYIKILQEALDESREEISGAPRPEPDIPKKDISINLPFPSFFPLSFIQDETIRLRYYQRLSTITSDAELQELRSEIIDIFGKIPPEGRYLFTMETLRLRCQPLNIHKISFKNGACHLFFNKEITFTSTERFIHTLNQVAGRLQISHKFLPGRKLHLVIFQSRSLLLKGLKQFLDMLIDEFNLLTFWRCTHD